MKKINNYENYAIESNGDVINLLTKKKLKGSISENGYKYYRLSKDNHKKMFYAHRLVAEHYLDNPQNLPVVNHKDGNKLNNDISNLEWVSYTDNMIHAYQNDLVAPISAAVKYEADLEGEEWLPYQDYTNYLVSNKGRVRNIHTNKLLKPSIVSGYYKVRLSKNGEVKDFLVHKLVYCIFNHEDYLQDKTYVIDHIDGNKLNNTAENLRKVSNSDNVMAALYEQKTNKSLKPVLQYSLDGWLLNEYPSCSEAARQLGLDSSTISKVCRGVNKTHGGYIFRYK